MPLPIALGIAAALAGIIGAGSGVHGAVKMKEANDSIKSANEHHKKNLARFKEQSKITNSDMDKLGGLELWILNSFQDFSDAFEKMKNRPDFEDYQKNVVHIPKYNSEKLKEVSIGAGVLLGGIGGAAAGTAGGFAAAGATTAAVMAVGTASTGTAISALSGAAATNATLAALGGGALAAGGGGIALGTTILGATTLGVGLLVGGVIFNVTGSSLSNKADEAWAQMWSAEQKINQICAYMRDLSQTANDYWASLSKVNRVYQVHLARLKRLVNVERKTNWNALTRSEQMSINNTVLLVDLLYNMCKVNLVLQSQNKNDLNTINRKAVEQSIRKADQFLLSKQLL